MSAGAGTAPERGYGGAWRAEGSTWGADASGLALGLQAAAGTRVQGEGFVVADAAGFWLDTLPEFGPEQWRPFPGHEDRADVSNWGEVRFWFSPGGLRLDEPRRTFGSLNRVTGYLRVGFRVERGGPITRPIHRAVLLAFAGAPQRGQIATHRNGDKQNNRLDNLAWATYGDNLRDARRHSGKALVGPRRESGRFR